MDKNSSLDAGLDAYSVTARTVLSLKPPTRRLGELTLYTAAAGSALALAPAAEASIIYSGVQNITVNRVTNGSSFAFVDLNFNGQGDIAFGINSSIIGGTQRDDAVAFGYPGRVPGQHGAARFFDNDGNSLLKLAASSRNIGANYGLNTSVKYFGGLRGHSATVGGNSSVFGLWNIGPSAATTGFAGVLIGSYLDPTVNQFGWLHFELTTDSANRADSLTLIDWAFESVPGASIHVGDPGTTSIPEPFTLGLLALGAAGLAALRRRRSQEADADRAH